jgi:antitoxin component of MazEF toxin-antitoxin module
MFIMIQSIQKIIKIGTSGGVTIPAKELKRQNIAFGDEVEVIVRPLHSSTNDGDKTVIASAKKILSTYKKDFDSLAKR